MTKTAHSNEDAKDTRNQGGFTLIELVVALTVFSIGLLGASMMQTASIRGNKSSASVSQSSNWAAGKMEEIMSWDYADARLLTAGGSDQSPDGQYTITWTVTDNTPVTDTKTVVITVTYNVRGIAKTSQFTSIFSQPI